MARHLNAADLSMVSKSVLQVTVVLIASLWSSRSALVVAASASATANQQSIHRFLSTPATDATSENCLLAIAITNSYGFAWPTPSGQKLGTNAAYVEDKNGASIRSGEPNGEIEREAIWAKADFAESVLEMRFEKDFFQLYSVMSSGRASLDTLLRVGYASNSKALHKYPRNREYSLGWM